MQTVAENSARIAIEPASINLKLPELDYLMLNLTAMANQLARYRLAENDVSSYVQSAAQAMGYVPPAEQVSLCAIKRIFEEINGYL